MPAAASTWPILLLMEPIATWSPAARPGPSTAASALGLDRVAERGAGAVRLHVAHPRGIDAGSRIGLHGADPPGRTDWAPSSRWFVHPD